jgi:predicted permease
MSFLSRIASLWRNLTRSRQVERELSDEVRSYVELATQAKVKDGLTEGEARREALVEFGGVEQVKEQVREARAGHFFETLFRDLQFGLRSLGKSPGFAAVAILTLALGIGANTAIFSIINAVVLQPLPYRAPDRLVKIWPEKIGTSVSKQDYLDIKNAAGSFDDIAAYSGWGFTITGNGDPAKLDGARATSTLFSLLGVNAVAGRTFLSNEDQPGHDKVALISYGLWQSRFGSDARIIGQPIIINGESHTLVGVMPKGFNFLGGQRCDLWLPATLDASNKEDFSNNYLMLLGRLKQGVTIEQAQSEITEISQRVRQQRLKSLSADKGGSARVISLQVEMVGDMRTTLFVLLGTVGLLLLIACANVANLQLARTSTRQRELAIRAALGASRARLVRQLLTESCLLSFIGAVAGVFIAWVGLNLLLTLIPADTPRLGEIAISRPVLFFSLGVSLLAGVLFGLAPALQISKPDLQAPLKEGGRVSSDGLRGRRLRSLLVISEIALALMLVTSAGLLIKSFWRLQHVDPGFDAEQLLSFQLSPPDFAEDVSNDAAARARTYYRQVLERLKSLPDVQLVGGIHLLPMGDSNWDPGLRIEDRPLPPGSSQGTVNWRLVTPDYFRTIKIPLLSGRSFNESDNESGEKVAIINATLARKYWPDADPIGKRIGSGFEGKGNWTTVVGVVGDIKQHGLGSETRPEMYRPYFQHTSLPPMTLIVRSTSAPAALAASIRSAVWSVDKNVPITDLQPLTDVVARSISQPRSTMLMLSIFACIGLTLGIIGIYGVISYSVAQRTQEIGVRMALGARTLDILQLVVGQGLKLTLIGVAAGVAGALAVTRLMSSLLFGVSATDPATFIIIAGLLIAVALLACYLPARRATRISPVTALRYE